jgi:dTDP-4-amino-4,6-dideoxygalactose transaminase
VNGENAEPIVFNRVHVTGAEFGYMQVAIENAHLASSGPFTALCTDWISQQTGCVQALLTHSCTGALELAFTLAGIGRGDEVIMPSFTFVTTANAVVACGGRPVFVDIHPDTLCVDERRVAAAITPKTKAIVPVHYAGVGSNMSTLCELGATHGLLVIEDAAQAVGARVDGRALGSIGQLGAYSFHETKNVCCGEGGAFVNDPRFQERAEIVHQKGTNRTSFLRGQVDKYTWVDVGSSYAMSELAAAYLWGQVQYEREITAARLEIWDRYHTSFAELETKELLRRPVVPPNCEHNAHMYYLLLRDAPTRTAFIDTLGSRGVNAVFHFVPLHSSPAGQRYASASGRLRVTTDVSDRLVRLPLWVDMTESQLDHVITCVWDFVRGHRALRQTMPRLRQAGR